MELLYVAYFMDSLKFSNDWPIPILFHRLKSTLILQEYFCSYDFLVIQRGALILWTAGDFVELEAGEQVIIFDLVYVAIDCFIYLFMA